ncbi:MAG: pantoate--beta-alanine ligase [Anaerolineae bacterium]|nr:pantoate--beta-alanine ligase [Anaerolineae bacterium]
MITVSSLTDLRKARKKLCEPVGFVPTMGYLHEGHISLVRRAKSECRSVVVSIYVNPSQFGPHEDFEKYPRNLEGDIALLEKAGVDLLWTPTNACMYPPGYQTWIDVEKLSQPLEGALRPGHFRGVATIVAKLFNCVQPQKAYFGQKDAQQAAIICQMTEDLNFPIDIVVCPTVREKDGLAMSSRNCYLTQEQRSAAKVMVQALDLARQLFEQGERQTAPLVEIVQHTVEQQTGVILQYAACVDPKTFLPMDTITDQALLLIAIQTGDTRLIDNIELTVAPVAG